MRRPPGAVALPLLATLLLAPSAARAQSSQDDLPVTQGKPKFTPPVLLERVAADYPPEAAAAGLEGTVVVEFTVDDKGVTQDVVVKQPAGHGFDEAAVAAVKQFKWKPGLDDRTPVPARVTYAYKFAIKKVVKRVAPAPLPPGEQPIRIAGSVLARGTRAPLVGASVFAAREGSAPVAGESGPGPATPRVETETDPDGRFELRGLPPGPYQIIVTGNGLVRAVFKETLPPDTRLTVRYYVDRTWASRYETTVRAAPVREEVSRQTLATEELVKMPGTMGDALRAVENLPGVARAPFNTGLLIVRGGKPSDSRAFFAGAEVPQLYHFGGFTSVIPTHLFEKVDYYPGNFPVRYGRAIAGAIDVDLREGKKDRLHGYADVNIFDTGVAVEGPVGKGSFIVGARRSYVDALLGLAQPLGLLNGAPVSFTTAPIYYDYQGVFDYPLAGGRVRAVLLGSDDTLKLLFDQPQGDPSVRGAFSTHIFFHRLQLRWQKSSGPLSFFIQNSSGYNGSDGQLGADLNFAVGVWESDTRIEGRWKVSKRLKLTLGIDTQYGNVSLGANVPVPAREGELMLPIAASNKYRSNDVLNIFNWAVYGEALVTATDGLTITPGVRLDYFSALHGGSFTVNPRVGVKYQLFPYTAIKAGVGLFSQDPQPQDYVKSFGNPDLRPENAIHYGLSVEQGILPGMMLEATGFYKTLYSLTVTSNADVVRDGVVQRERVANTGEGRIYGGEFLLRQSLSKWFFGWIAYTLMRSERRDCPTRPAPHCTDWHTFDYDQTHIFVLAVHANFPRGFEAGLRFRYISGYPYTLAGGGHLDSDGDVYVAGRFPINTARLAPFNQLDVRFDKTFIFDRWVLKLYLDLTNVYSNANEEQVQYSFDYKQHTALTGLPFLPSFGIRGEF